MKSKNLHVGFSRWWPALAWAAALFTLSSIPGSGGPVLAFEHSDKLAHFLAYAILAAACARGWWPSSASPRDREAEPPPDHAPGRAAVVLVAAAMATAYGLSDELHQSFVPGREPDWRDALADALGSLAGAWIYVRRRARGERRAVARDFRS